MSETMITVTRGGDQGAACLQCGRTDPASPWMTKAEVADFHRVGERTIDRWTDAGKLTRYSVADLQSVRFSRAEVEGLVVLKTD